MRELLELWNAAAAKRAAVDRGRAVPTIQERRDAAKALRRSFERIERDYSEAYEQCRSDPQRRALEEARRHARAVYLRVLREEALEDQEGWRQAESDFNAGRTKVARPLSALKGAGAVIRILNRLAGIAEQLAILAA